MTGHSFYLQQMGVTTWHLRSKVDALIAEDSWLVFLENQQQTRIGAIVADKKMGDVSIALQEELLLKIAGVLSPTFKINSTLLDKIDFATESLQYVILLGDAAISHLNPQTLNDACACIQSVSLEALFGNSHEKKVLWQQLKPLCL